MWLKVYILCVGWHIRENTLVVLGRGYLVKLWCEHGHLGTNTTRKFGYSNICFDVVRGYKKLDLCGTVVVVVVVVVIDLFSVRSEVQRRTHTTGNGFVYLQPCCHFV